MGYTIPKQTFGMTNKPTLTLLIALQTNILTVGHYLVTHETWLGFFRIAPKTLGSGVGAKHGIRFDQRQRNFLGKQFYGALLKKIPRGR